MLLITTLQFAAWFIQAMFPPMMAPTTDLSGNWKLVATGDNARIQATDELLVPRIWHFEKNGNGYFEITGEVVIDESGESKAKFRRIYFNYIPSTVSPPLGIRMQLLDQGSTNAVILEGIYEIQDNKMRLSYGKERPKSFPKILQGNKFPILLLSKN